MADFKVLDMDVAQQKVAELGKVIEEASAGVSKFANDVAALAEAGGTVNLGEKAAAILGQAQQAFKQMETSHTEMNKIFTQYIAGLEEAANADLGKEIDI